MQEDKLSHTKAYHLSFENNYCYILNVFLVSGTMLSLLYI